MRTHPRIRFLNSLSLGCSMALIMALTACNKSKPPEVADTKPENVVVSGEMFIRTKGGDTVKLSGQEVQFYSKEVILEAMASAKASADTEVPPFDEQIQKRSTQAEDLNKLMNESIKVNLSIDPEIESMIKELKAYLNGLNEAKSAWPHASYVFTFFPKTEHKTRTNSDAKFEIELPPGKWVAVAEASRQVGSDEERYYWTVLMNPKQNTLLDNSNLVTSKSEESVIHLNLGHFKLK
jgi:hypothetical protein